MTQWEDSSVAGGQVPKIILSSKLLTLALCLYSML